MNRIRRALTILTLLSCTALSVFAQSGAHNAYSPYSVYGLGTLQKEGNAYTRTMGGIGIATRNRRFINYVNPAAITARDTLSFMADFGLQENNQVYRQNTDAGKLKSANNTFNISDLAITFPIWRSSAMVIGIAPYSDVGYDFSSYETNQDLIGVTNNITYQSYGEGGVYQIFAGAGATFWKRLSIGAEAIYYFGTIDKVTNTLFTDGSYRSINAGYEAQIRTFTGKFGIQYDQPLWGDVKMTVGATYKPKTRVRGRMTDYCYAVSSELADTLRGKDSQVIELKNSGVSFGDELGIGIALKGGEQWSVEFNYVRGDWRQSNFSNVNGFNVRNASGNIFTSSVSNSFRAGFEVVPNRNDIRYYYKKISYRGGFYYETANYLLSNNVVTNTGITLGITLPILRLYNGLTLGVDVGQRGNLKSSEMVRERYATIMVGFNLHDIWFQKMRYN